jgi:tRNA-dihydrouridine synthase B
VRIGSHALPNGLVVAPMAGVTDRPFRQLCRRLGAGYAVSEMVGSDPRLVDTPKTRRRTDHAGEPAPIAVQIAGAAPALLAAAARHNVARGAQIIDINMGCPAKKVCNAAAGSALLSDEALVARILDAVVAAVDVPVTLKIRTGPDPAHRNALAIARIAERAGIAALTVHGRTRACLFKGTVEYETIAAVKASVTIPVIANGDIDSPERARDVLARTGADAIMIGRAAQGRPWIFREIAHFLGSGHHLPPPTVAEARELILAHLADHYAFHGEAQGVRIARKHLGWYVRGLAGGEAARAAVIGNAAQQLHPVAGQGFNLGLRDAWELARTILDAPREAIGGGTMLAAYAARRRIDRGAGIAFTHGLVRIFGNDMPLARWSRGFALALLDVVPPAKRAFTRAMLHGMH